MNNYGYAIVQHSGYNTGHEEFAHATEAVALMTKAGRALVVKVGGIAFDTYEEAEAFSEKANFPPGTEGLVPNAQGTFSRRTIDGLRIYIPVREATG